MYGINAADRSTRQKSELPAAQPVKWAQNRQNDGNRLEIGAFPPK
jgi:hypothetical protein